MNAPDRSLPDCVSPRPTLDQLGSRRARALHRTLPTWAREVTAQGKVQWRMYVPHQAGGALHIAATFSPDTPRREVADQLRIYRGALWGRDKVRGIAALAEQAAVESEPGGEATPMLEPAAAIAEQPLTTETVVLAEEGITDERAALPSVIMGIEAPPVVSNQGSLF